LAPSFFEQILEKIGLQVNRGGAMVMLKKAGD
jgi:hypothetical protein